MSNYEASNWDYGGKKLFREGKVILALEMSILSF